MEELKTRSFRVSEEVSSKLKAVCADFDNQNSALDALIKAYEVQVAKAVIVDRKTELADLDTHLQAIQTAFLRSLELNENAEKRIRAEFNSLLTSKDETIMQLQAEKAQLQEQAGQAETAYNALKQATDERIEEMQGKVSESEKIAQNATERATEAIKAREQAEKISAMTAEQAETIKRQLQELKDKAEQSDNYKAELEKVKAEINQLKQQMEFAVKSAVAEITEKYQTKIEEIQAIHARQMSELLVQQSKAVTAKRK